MLSAELRWVQYSPLCTLHFAFCIQHFTSRIQHSALCTLHSAFRILHSAFCVPYSAKKKAVACATAFFYISNPIVTVRNYFVMVTVRVAESHPTSQPKASEIARTGTRVRFSTI